MHSFAHVAGITDTNIHVNNSSIDLLYTVPSDNLNELKLNESNKLIPIIINAFEVSNVIHIEQTKEQESVNCRGQLISQRHLKNIESEQFHLRYSCANAFEILHIKYTLFINEYESHTNHVRLSIAGRNQSFIYSINKQSHYLHIKKLLNKWGVILNNTHTETLDVNSLKATVHNSFMNILLQSTHYITIGIEHILLGYDHVLFLIGLLLLPLGLRSLLIITTMFTLAHSMTLAVSIFELFTLPAPYVEALIALSIVYIAIENINFLREKKSIRDGSHDQYNWRKRAVITFGFGLLHGFGFSYVLKEIGLGDHIVGSLLFFNMGVELGQLLIISICFPILYYTFKQVWGNKLAISLSALVGAMGLFWLFQRIYSLI